MNKLQTMLIFLLSIIFISIIISSLYYIQEITSSINEEIKLENKNRDSLYHFVFIAPELNDPSWDDVKSGVVLASEEFDVSVEFVGADKYDKLQEENYMKIAVDSNVDGIITHVSDVESMTNLIDRAYSKNIPVITVGNDAPDSERILHISKNNYSIGKNAGNILAYLKNEASRVAIMLKTYNKDNSNLSDDLTIAGFKEGIKVNGNIALDIIELSNGNLFEAERICRNLINENKLKPKGKSIDTIFCTGINETLGTVQAVVDANEVGNYTIIGFGYTPEIKKYIDKDIISASIVSDNSFLGYEAIHQLVIFKNKSDKYINRFMTIPFDYKSSRYIPNLELGIQ